jgi:hypothetical protein
LEPLSAPQGVIQRVCYVMCRSEASALSAAQRCGTPHTGARKTADWRVNFSELQVDLQFQVPNFQGKFVSLEVDLHLHLYLQTCRRDFDQKFQVPRKVVKSCRFARRAPGPFGPSPEHKGKKSSPCSKCGPFTDCGGISSRVIEWLAAAQASAAYERHAVGALNIPARKIGQNCVLQMLAKSQFPYDERMMWVLLVLLVGTPQCRDYTHQCL